MRLVSIWKVIKSFKDRESEKIWAGMFSKKLPSEIQKNAQMKLGMINNIKDIEELRVPPGNRLHKLSGDRNGQYSISINSQWRICFNFENENADNVEITDYH
jgi:toxin HigB-1